jgi:hypothetical protein
VKDGLCVSPDCDCVFQIQGWEKLPSDKPLMTVFSRASGQEWFFADLKKEVVQSLIKVRK